MTQEAALYQFFNSFGLNGYPVTAVPDDVAFPYLTYTLQTDSWCGSVSLTINIWTKTDSEAAANANARLLSNAVPLGGVQVPCDNGVLWLRRGSPWCSSVSNSYNSSSYSVEDDNTIKQRYFNLTVEYLTI